MKPPNKHNKVLSGHDLNLLGSLLLPSWLSGLIVVLASLILVFGSIALLHYHDSSWQLVLPVRHQSSSPLVKPGAEVPTDQTTANVILEDLPLLVFWAGVGTIIYSFAVAAVNAYSNIVNLKQEMNYVHADSRQRLRRATGSLLFRSIVLLFWVMYISFSLHLLLPYAVALAYAGSGTLGWLYDTAYIVAAIGLSVICLHLHTVLLRLLFLKPRLFGSVIKA